MKCNSKFQWAIIDSNLNLKKKKNTPMQLIMIL